jgi:cytochrome c-type biogenesis protein CcmH/NrfG
MRRPDPLQRRIEPVTPWVVRHVPTAPAYRWVFPRAVAVVAVCLVLLLATGLADQARDWVGDLLNQHFGRVDTGDRNGLLQPERAR